VLGRVRWRHVVELGAHGEAPDDRDGLGQPTDVVLGGITPIRQALHGAPGQLRGQTIEDVPSPLTPGTRGDMELRGVRCLQVEFQTDRYPEARAGPAREGNVPPAQDAVHTSQRPICLAGGARAMAIAGKPCKVVPRFFLRRIVEADAHDCAGRDQLGRQAADSPPEMPALLGERAPEEPREA
jgi:hypothetical protein